MIQKKICVLGPSSVGKTSLIRRYVEGIFSGNYLTTIGVKIDKKIVNLANNNVELLVWDIEGTDIFSGFNKRYLRGASAFILVVDQSRRSSVLDAIELFNLVKSSHDIPAFLAINKSDLENQLTDEDRQALMNLSIDGMVITSAKSGSHVETLFSKIANNLAGSVIHE